MLRALIYLQTRSFWNGVGVRVKRLRQPKYLVGAIIGSVWFAWMFGGPLFLQTMGHRHPGRVPPAGAASAARMLGLGDDTRQLIEGVGAAGLAVWMLMAWLLPGARAALVFTEAEVAFLFPAPFTRRGLIHYKLLRWQLGLVVTSLVFTLFTGRVLRDGHWLIHLGGWWITLFILNLHALGASFTMTRLMDAGLSSWKRRGVILAAVAAVAGGVGWWAMRNLPALGDAENPLEMGRALLNSPPGYWLLWPFRLLIRPWFAESLAEFLAAAWAPVAFLGLHYWWVIRAEVSFEEASIALAQKRAELVAAARGGNWQAAQSPRKPQRAPFRLAPNGLPSVALLWKNLISAGAVLSGRTGIFLVLWLSVMGVSFASGSNQGIVGILMAVGGMGLVMLTLMGSQFFRNDLRQDLAAVEVLKQFPMPGWQVVLGELLAPAVMLTGLQWMLVLVLLALSTALRDLGDFHFGARVSVALCIAVLAPAYNLVALIVPNTATLLFPAWFQSGRDGPAGFEVMGQRLLFTFGTLFAMAISLVPATLVFGGVWFVLQLAVPPWIAAPVAAVVAAAVLVAEAGLGMWWLGRLFERFDVTSD